MLPSTQFIVVSFFLSFLSVCLLFSTSRVQCAWCWTQRINDRFQFQLAVHELLMHATMLVVESLFCIFIHSFVTHSIVLIGVCMLYSYPSHECAWGRDRFFSSPLTSAFRVSCSVATRVGDQMKSILPFFQLGLLLSLPSFVFIRIFGVHWLHPALFYACLSNALPKYSQQLLAMLSSVRLVYMYNTEYLGSFLAYCVRGEKRVDSVVLVCDTHQLHYFRLLK